MTLWLLIGLGLLIVGGELLVRSAVHIAQRLRVSTLVIGLTVVAFGTGAPELAVSVYANLTGNPNIAVGNVIGSNIINILLILGLSAIIRPILVQDKLVQVDVPIMIGISLLLYLMSFDGVIARWQGAILFFSMILYSFFSFWIEKKQDQSELMHVPPPSHRKWYVEVVILLLAFACLIYGSEYLVKGAVAIAKLLGVSDLVIALTIIAIGTSLPELFASMTAMIRDERDLAAGNIVGSNIFNILAVIGFAAMIAPHGLKVAPAVINFDMPVMIAVAFACLPLFLMEHLISRWQGWLFFFYYLAYTLFLILNASHHDLLEPYSQVMLYFCIPITVITISVIAARSKAHRNDFR